jgi:mono/diheme cytochrome c family protein
MSMLRCVVLSALTAIMTFVCDVPARAADPQIERGKYLVAVGGCTDCHTPGHFFGHPDMSKYLAGSDVGFGMPEMGVFVGSNLTPDKETGLGKWTAQQIVTAITAGRTPDGRILAPMMPWRGLSALSPKDALAIAAFLKSLPAVKNKVPGPFGASEVPTVAVMSIVPGAVYAAQQSKR